MKERGKMEKYRHWLWILDYRFVCSIAALVVVTTVASMFLGGMVTTVVDPANAVYNQRHSKSTDFSFGVQVKVVPDKPVGIELRKVDEDETVHLLDAGN